MTPVAIGQHTPAILPEILTKPFPIFLISVGNDSYVIVYSALYPKFTTKFRKLVTIITYISYTEITLGSI